MYLKSIEIHGFKSFANKITFEFPPGITGIVGPNGSGKSNVADAVRWVLGEQKIKQLRGSKMEDVIFAGTSARKPQSYAFVAITLDNSDHKLNIDFDAMKKSLENFAGADRRFKFIGLSNGISFFDDYAHHPTEIKATLSSAEGMSDKHIIAVFQPHRYTRLKNLWNEFLDAFDGVDEVVVTDVYAASEDVIDGVNSKNFARDLSDHISIPCKYIPGSIAEVAAKLYPALEENDVVIGLGAGTITNLSKELVSIKDEVCEIAH